jgi:hypothetical protein
MKNQECSNLVKEYKKKVVEYNECNDRIIRNKFEMSYLWKYKKDYPADWKRKAEMLTNDRDQLNEIKHNIISIKYKLKKFNSEFNKNKK